MTLWLKRFLPVGILVGLLAWQPLWVLFALLVPGIAIVEGASVVASWFTPDRVDRIGTGVHFSMPLLNDTAVGLAPIVAVGFWILAGFVWLAARERRRRNRRGLLKPSP